MKKILARIIVQLLIFTIVSLKLYAQKDIKVVVADSNKITIQKNNLSEVTINGSKPLFQRKSDRFIYNVGNSPATIGNTVWDILKQTPMVQVIEPSTVKVTGSPQETTIYINRRKFALTGDNLSAFLKSMPADNLLQIEILTIPPPYYDAGGPVIDIILKHLDINGLKGTSSVTYEKAKEDRANTATVVDYNSNNYNQSFLISGTEGDYFKGIEKNTNFTGASPSSVYSDILIKAHKKALSAYTDISYSISPVTTIGTQVIYNDIRLNTFGNGKEILSPTAISSIYSQNNFAKNKLVDGNAFVKFNSEKTGRFLEITTDYLRANNREDSQFFTNLENGSFETLVPQKIETYSIKADFIYPIFKTINFSGGVKYSKSTIKTPYEAFNIEDMLAVRDNELSANFTYKENVTSAYATIEKDFGKLWSSKIGVRIENTQTNTTTEGVETQKNSNSYTFLFPVGYLNYTPNNTHSFSLTSKLSNNRPDYSTLNPARRLLGNRTLTEGNPFLSPSTGGIVELMYSYKQAYYFGLNYSRYDRLFTQLNQVLNKDTLLIRWENWGNQSQFNFWTFTAKDFFSGHYHITFNSNLGYYRRQFSEEVTAPKKISDNMQLNITINQNTKDLISKNLKFYINSNFSTPSRYGLWTDQQCSFRFDFLTTYNLPKINLSVTLIVNDLVKYNDRHLYTVNETSLQKTTVLNNNDSRSFRISISKGFGNTKTRKLQKRETSNEEEKKRAQ